MATDDLRLPKPLFDRICALVGELPTKIGMQFMPALLNLQPVEDHPAEPNEDIASLNGGADLAAAARLPALGAGGRPARRAS